jgi:hypothetical protein
MSKNSAKLIQAGKRHDGLGTPCHLCEKEITEMPYVRRYNGGRQNISPSVYYHPECARKVLIID